MGYNWKVTPATVAVCYVTVAMLERTGDCTVVIEGNQLVAFIFFLWLIISTAWFETLICRLRDTF